MSIFISSLSSNVEDELPLLSKKGYIFFFWRGVVYLFVCLFLVSFVYLFNGLSTFLGYKERY